jgi:hypothetical protein
LTEKLTPKISEYPCKYRVNQRFRAHTLIWQLTPLCNTRRECIVPSTKKGHARIVKSKVRMWEISATIEKLDNLLVFLSSLSSWKVEERT